MDIDAEFVRIRKRLTALEARPVGGSSPGIEPITDLWTAFDGLETRVTALSGQFEGLNGALARVETALEALRHPPLALTDPQPAVSTEAPAGT